jgi:hypothetical protein
VGSERGLYAVSAHDFTRRRISAGAALHPRWLDEVHVVVLHPRAPQGFFGGATVERVSVCDGARERLAELPRFRCANMSAADNGTIDFDVQDTRDVCLSADKQTLCIGLMDRNWNMASYRLEVQAELTSGVVKRRLEIGAESCKAPRDALPKGPPLPEPCDCDVDDPKPSAAAFPFGFDEGRVTEHAEGVPVPRLWLDEYQRESTSPSGRFMVLGGDEVEQDYLYRRLVLLDRLTGDVYPVADQPASWPKRVATPGQKRRHVALPILTAGLFPRETVPTWLKLGASELLALDHLVITPFSPSRTLDGELAR